MIKELFVSYMIPLYDKNALEKVVHTNHIRFIILHGSQATQREHEGSDIDILIEFTKVNIDKYLYEK